MAKIGAGLETRGLRAFVVIGRFLLVSGASLGVLGDAMYIYDWPPTDSPLAFIYCNASVTLGLPEARTWVRVSTSDILSM